MAAGRDENLMASNVVVSGADEPDDEKVPAPRPSGGSAKAQPGFFTIYKRGQGKWTRLGTVFAAALLGLLTAYNLYKYALPYLPIYDPTHPSNHAADHARQALLAVTILFLVGFSLLVFWLVNKPKNVDFLISTDSEMKKVNWTTKGELFGSTRIVVLFLFLIAIFLFAADKVFQLFFHLIGVLKV